MFTTVQQIESWIRDNNLTHWIFTRGDRSLPKGDGAEPNDKILDSDYLGDDLEQKIELTKRILNDYQGRIYGTGWYGKKATGGLWCEVQLFGGGSNPTNGVGATQPPFDIGKLEESISKRIHAEIEAENYKRERADFEREKKEFEEAKTSVIGQLVETFAPYIPVLKNLGGQRRMVAGVDANEPVHAAPIVADAPETEEPETESPFTDEEADQLFALMARFKAVEPDYLKLIESVVTMAESGDSTYKMAKNFLVK